MKLEEVKKLQARAYEFLKNANIIITEEEKKNIEVADLGLNDIDHIGVEIIVYINTRYCAKELILFPYQICPEHKHPPVDEQNTGKQETFRCRWGKVYLYVQGEPTLSPQARIPEKYKQYFTVWKEIVLLPGMQYTIPSGTLHWFQAGEDGAVVSEFSSTSLDDKDIFTDPHIKRIPEIEE